MGGHGTQKVRECPRSNIEAKRHGLELPHLSLHGDPEEVLEAWIDGNVQIGIRQVDGRSPFPLAELLADGARSFHTEGPAGDILIEGLQVYHRPETPGLFGDYKQM